MTPEDELRQAGKAREVLENEAFKEAFNEIEAAILRGLRQTAFKDSELREKLCARYDLLHSLRDQLQSFIDTGAFAEEEIRRRTIAEKVKDLFCIRTKKWDLRQVRHRKARLCIRVGPVLTFPSRSTS